MYLFICLIRATSELGIVVPLDEAVLGESRDGVLKLVVKESDVWIPSSSAAAMASRITPSTRLRNSSSGERVLSLTAHHPRASRPHRGSAASKKHQARPVPGSKSGGIGVGRRPRSTG
jgi:hypothetical protein